MKQTWTTTLALWLPCAWGTLAAQESNEITRGVAACAAIESAVARLDCFDELARAQRAESPPPTPRAAERAASQPPASSDRAAPQVEAAAGSDTRTSRRGSRAADRAERELTSEVAAIREIQPGRIEVTLTNGQVWRQTNTDPYNLLVGHEVRLYPSAFGQYFRLSSKEVRSFIQVERVR